MANDQKIEARLKALRSWAQDVKARGFIPPSESDLEQIAAGGKIPENGENSGLTGAWKGAIGTLLRQVTFNISMPHKQLGPEFDNPENPSAIPAATNAAPLKGESVSQENQGQAVPGQAAQGLAAPGQSAQGQQGGATLVSRRLELLRKWRAHALEIDTPFASALRDRNLNALANSEPEIEVIKAQLPGNTQVFAPELLNLLLSVSVNPEPASGSHASPLGSQSGAEQSSRPFREAQPAQQSFPDSRRTARDQAATSAPGQMPSGNYQSNPAPQADAAGRPTGQHVAAPPTSSIPAPPLQRPAHDEPVQAKMPTTAPPQQQTQQHQTQQHQASQQQSPHVARPSQPHQPPQPQREPQAEQRSQASASNVNAGNLTTGNGGAQTAPLSIDPGSFAAYNFIPANIAVAEARQNKLANGSLRYSWEASQEPGDFKVYRVVSGDNMVPYTPDQANLVDITTETSAQDTREFSTAVRHVQIWCHAGKDLDDAVGSQPWLHASIDLVAEVPHIDIREDEGRVIGQWTVLDGTLKVHIYRIPIAQALGVNADQQYRILSDANNLGGFVDTGAVRGASYIYQVFAEATVNGVQRLSPPKIVQLTVSSILLPVEDLEVRLQPEQEDGLVLCDLRWSTPPGGRVDIYRTQTPPTPGIELKALEEAALSQGGLNLQLRMAHPIEKVGEKSTMMGVPWPVDWTRAYFTPVTVLDGRAHVGTSRVSSRPTRIRNAKIVERVDSQILTFEWPDGADAVMVYQAAVGQGAEAAMGGQPLEITHSRYNQRGGLYFERLLPADGCELHLVPVSFEAGNRVNGTVTSIRYNWILRVSYWVAARRNRMSGKLNGFAVQVRAHQEVGGLPQFVLVHNPERLPLTAADGIALNMVRETDNSPQGIRAFSPESRPADVPQDTWITDPASWERDVSSPSGFVRLFANLDPERAQQLALLDPDVNELRLGTNGGWARFGGR